MKMTKQMTLWAQSKFAEGYTKGEITQALGIARSTLSDGFKKYKLHFKGPELEAPDGLLKKGGNQKLTLNDEGIAWAREMYRQGYTQSTIACALGVGQLLVQKATCGVKREKRPLIWPELAAGDVVRYRNEEFVIEKIKDKKVHIGTHIVDPEEVKLIRRRVYSEEDDF